MFKREKYLKENVFWNFFDIFWNKLGRKSQKFAAGVTKLEDLTVAYKFHTDTMVCSYTRVGFYVLKLAKNSSLYVQQFMVLMYTSFLLIGTFA